MAQSSAAKTPESLRAQIAAARLLQQGAAANTGPYTSGGVTALKAIEGLMGGIQERNATQADAAAQAQSSAVLAAALREKAGQTQAPTFGALAAMAGSAPAASRPAAPGLIPGSAPTRSSGSFDPSGINWDRGGPQNDQKRATLMGYAVNNLGLSPTSAAALIGHADAESNFRPGVFNPTGEKSHGLFQWNEDAGRWSPFVNWAQQNGRSTTDPIAQLDYAKVEASRMKGANGQSVWDNLASAPNLATASRSWMDGFEQPKVRDYGNRINLGNAALRAYQADGGQAAMPASNAQPVSSDTLPPGVTPDMVSAPPASPSPYGAMPMSMAQAPAQPDTAALAAALRGSAASPLPATVQPSSPFGAMPQSMGQAPAPLPSPTLADVPPPAPQPSPFGAGPQPMQAQAGPDQKALAAALLRQGQSAPAPAPAVPMPDPTMAASPDLSAMLAPPDAAPMPAPIPDPAQQAAMALPSPDDPVGGMMGSPAAPPSLPDITTNAMASAGYDTAGLPGAVPPAPQPAPPAPAALVPPSLPPMQPVPGPTSPTEQLNATDYALSPTGTRDQFPPNPRAPGLNGMASLDPTALSPFADPSASPMMPATGPTPPPGAQTLAAALRGGVPGGSAPLPTLAGPNVPPPSQTNPAPPQPDMAVASLPQTGPMPPVRPSNTALGLNPDAPAPNAVPAGSAPLTNQMARALAQQTQAQPLGLLGDGGGDPSSPQAFLRQEAARAAGGTSYTSPAARALAGQSAAALPSPATQDDGGSPLDAIGRLLGGLGGGQGQSGGNPLAGLPMIGGVFSGGQQLGAGPGGQAAGSSAYGGQGQGQPFTPAGQAAGSTPQGSQTMSNAAINAAIMDPRISDSVKMKLMEAPEHSFAVAPNGTMYDTKTGRTMGGDFEKPAQQQSVQTPDGRIFSFDPTRGIYKEGPSGSPAPTSDMRNYDAYAAQETAAGRAPLSRMGYETALKTAGKTEVTVNNKDENAEAQARGTARAKRLGDIADDGSKITDDTIKYQRLGDLLNTVNTGPKTAYLEKIRQGTGLTLDPNTDQVQALNAAIQQIVPTLHVSGSGATSDRDQANFIQSLPTLAGSPGGNQKILDTLNGTLAYRQQRAAIAQQYQDNKIDAVEADRQINALPSPFAPKKDAPGSVAQPQVGAPDASVARPVDKAGYDALPSGTQFMAPDGSMRRKP